MKNLNRVRPDNTVEPSQSQSQSQLTGQGNDTETPAYLRPLNLNLPGVACMDLECITALFYVADAIQMNAEMLRKSVLPYIKDQTDRIPFLEAIFMADRVSASQCVPPSLAFLGIAMKVPLDLGHVLFWLCDPIYRWRDRIRDEIKAKRSPLLPDLMLAEALVISETFLEQAANGTDLTTLQDSDDKQTPCFKLACAVKAAMLDNPPRLRATVCGNG